MIDGTFQIESGSAAQPRFLFKPGSWLSKIDFINHLVLFNNVLISVLSEKEGGKTSFATLLKNHLQEQIKSISIRATAPSNREELIQLLCTELHLNHDRKTDFDAITKQVNERRNQVLLIVDDAHNLKEQIIKELLSAIKGQGEQAYLHLCFISDYSLIATLNNLALDEFNDLIHTIEIGPLTESESRTYVLQRAMAERLINKPLTEQQYKKFHQQTKGNIAKINHNLEAYIHKMSQQRHKENKVIIKRTAAVVAASVIAGLSYVYVEHGRTPFHELRTIAKSEQIPPARAAVAQAQIKTAPEILLSQIPFIEEQAQRELVAHSLASAQSLTQIAEASKHSVKDNLQQALYIPPVPKPSEENNPAKTTELATKSQHNKEETKKVNSIAKNTAKHSVDKESKKGYTIQLAASHKKSDIHQFRKRKNLTEKTSIHQFKNEKGTWYVLTYGVYTDRQHANKTMQKLPKELTQLNPWIRAVSGLEMVG